MQVKIQKVDLSVTNNGTIKGIIFPEGADINNASEGIEILGDSVIYLATRKVGETVEIVEKGRWKNLVVPKEYADALNSPSYDRIKILFKRAVSGLNKMVNGIRTQLDFDTAKVLLTDNLELFLKTQDFVLNTLKQYKTTFSKQIISDIKSEDINTQFNAWKIINDLTYRSLNEISKDYKIINNMEELKEK